jgi:hypothetical protein
LAFMASKPAEDGVSSGSSSLGSVSSENPTSSVNALILYAIRNRRKIRFQYHHFSRTGDPYMFGISPKGKPAIQLYQSGGKSSSGTLHRLKYFILAEMTAVQLLNKPFTDEDEMEDYYDPEDSFFGTIFEQVDV